MKKIIAMLLVLSMVLSFAACGKNDKTPQMTVPIPTEPSIAETEPTETEPAGTEPVVEEPEVSVVPELTIPTPELPTDETLVANKQSTYEKAINEGLFALDSNSVTMNFANIFTLSMFVDGESKTLLALSGASEGMELDLALYVVSETEAYYHRKGIEAGVEMNEWYKLENLVNENGESVISTVTSDTTNSLTEFQNNIQSVTYVGVINGQDVVELQYLVEDETQEGQIIVDADYEFEYNGQKGLFRHTESMSAEGWTSSSESWKESPEGFESFDWDYDAEQQVLVHEETGETLICTMVTDHTTGEGAESNCATVMLVLDPETYNVSTMYMEQDGVLVVADFAPVEDLSDVFEIPDNITNTMSANDAAMELAMGMLIFILSAAGMGNSGSALG